MLTLTFVPRCRSSPWSGIRTAYFLRLKAAALIDGKTALMRNGELQERGCGGKRANGEKFSAIYGDGILFS